MRLAKQQIARQFSRAAGTYDLAAQLQNQVAEKLIDSIPAQLHGVVVDLGCGTGWALEKIALLGRPNNRFELTAVDIAPGMIEVAQARVASAKFHCCDLEKTPLADHIADLVFTSSSIQWCDTAAAMQEIKRISKPGGLLLASTFGPGTFTELRSAWLSAGDRQSRVHDFDSCETIETIMRQQGFKDVTLGSEIHQVEFNSVDELLQSIKQIGATNASATRQPGLLGTQRYREFRSVLEQRLASDGKLSLAFEAIFVSARIGEKKVA